jgi:TetR/AcrR family transcriptional regulator, tetracycline repressor protein
MAKGITRDAIVSAALAVLDESGLDGLTVRAVADRLEVKAPALYWHVRDKQELLDEMGTRVWARIGAGAIAEPGDTWRDALARYAELARHALLEHRDGARVFSGTYLTDPAVLQRQEAGLAWMEEQGFSVDATVDAYGIVTSFVVGHCIEEQARAQAPDDRYSLDARDERIDAATHPRVAASGRRIVDGGRDERFRTLLGIVLDGIEANRRPA